MGTDLTTPTTPTTPTAPAASTHPREDRRQRAVESLGLAEDGSHTALDRITRLARTVFGVAISTVTVLDQDRAWFPSAQGFESPGVARADTFCDRTTEEDTVLVVPDARLDPRFAHLPVVAEGGIRFYAGAPLRDPLGNILATLCLFDPEARTLSGEQLITFLDLAAWAQQELVASHEMSAASRVQSSMLPEAPLVVDGWHLQGICLPALAVGGDFFDYGASRGVVHLGLGDVMGKGTGAALVGAGVRASIRGTHDAVTAGVDLGITATQVARSMMPDLERTESFVTLFEAAIDLDDGFTRYVDAGAGLTLVVRRDGTHERLTSLDHPLGVLPGDHWTEHHTTVEPGDRLVVFSDGLLDLLDDPARWWEPVGRMVADAADAADLLATIAELTHERTALDDVTVLAVFRGEAGAPR